MERIHAIVSGIVQGVFFRSFVKKEAEILKLKGFVRNLDDGTVEVVAEGNKNLLLKFIERLKTGPNGARVDGVKIEWQNVKSEFKNFDILF